LNGFPLDTNVPSELIRARPEPRVAEWVYSQDEQSLYLSAVSIGELRRGFVVLPKGKRRAELELWFENDLLVRFRGRILPDTYSIADRWGNLHCAGIRFNGRHAERERFRRSWHYCLQSLGCGVKRRARALVPAMPNSVLHLPELIASVSRSGSAARR
jgi:predicted nucleic acid-binding protein